MKNLKYVYNVREVSTIRELLESSCELFAQKTAFLFRKDGTGVEITYEKLFKDVKEFSTYLNSLGLTGKKIAVSGKNSYDWAISYLAITCGCGIVVPLDKDLSEKEVNFILGHSEASAVIYSDEISEKFELCSDDIIKINMKNIPEYKELGERLMKNGDKSYAEHKINPYELGVLLYTSGTTGVAKGVMLSQYNIVSDIVHIRRAAMLTSDDRSISVLPLHHTYECTIGFLAMLHGGASIAISASLKTLKKEIEEYKPTIFVSVPMILERFHKLILDKYSKIRGGESIISIQRVVAKIGNTEFRKRIFSAVNDAFGGRMRLILCGAAPLEEHIHRDFELFGIKTYIGYGLTETSPVCLMHNDFYRSVYDNGYPVIGTDAKIVNPNSDGIGEIAVRGPNVMLGYYKNPEETARVLKDGWFYTGDLARKNPDGTFKIVGRLKSMIVTPGGKKIFPEELELELMQNNLVEECLVFGVESQGKVIVCASIYPSEDRVSQELLKRGITNDSPEYNKAKKELIMSIITTLNDSLPSYKVIRRLIVREEEFIKTTTKKIKRNEPLNLI